MLVRDGKPLATPFLDIQDLVLSVDDSGGGGEEGLLSIAFPPDYQQSGICYAEREGNVYQLVETP
jgi:hypothetical protein